jgi:hypothetical protein
MLDDVVFLVDFDILPLIDGSGDGFLDDLPSIFL